MPPPKSGAKPRPKPEKTGKPTIPVAARRAWRAKRRVLAEWRGVDLTDQEKAWASPGKPLGELLPHSLGGLRLDRKQAETQIVTVWRQVVDPLVSAHAQPVGLVRGTLFVAVDSSVWLDEIIRYRRKEILERMQHALGREMIQRASFRVG